MSAVDMFVFVTSKSRPSGSQMQWAGMSTGKRPDIRIYVCIIYVSSERWNDIAGYCRQDHTCH